MTPITSLRRKFTFAEHRTALHGWQTLGTLIVLGSTACGSGDSPTVVAGPGAISVTTETSGFLKDLSYDLLVDGVSAGTIGADDEMVISGLDPGTYDLDLGDLAANCVVEGTSADVVSAETVAASLSVLCDHDEPTSYSIRSNRDRPNLEDGVITECTFGLCPSDDEWDFYVYFDSQSDPQSVVRQNQTTAVEIAHVTGVGLEGLTEEDVQSATFTTELVPESFDSGRVILVRTDAGNVYGLGNPVENTLLLTLTFDAVLLVPNGP